MTFIEDERIPIVSKSSNYSLAAVFSTTLDDIYISLIANNCNNYSYDDPKNSGIIGTKSFSNNIYETYIGNKQNEQITKIAKFRNDNIFLETNTNIKGNILPSSNIYNIGASDNQWNSIYLLNNINNITSNELNTLSGIKNNIQTQLDNSNLFIINTSNEISNRITKLIIEQINIGSNNLLQSSNDIINLITNLNLDQIANGNTNKFIKSGINNTYTADITILGLLTTSNLNVIGDTTIINTQTYRTENLDIYSESLDGPTIKVTQIGQKNIAEFYDGSANNTSNVMVIMKGGNIGIGTNSSTSKLHLHTSNILQNVELKFSDNTTGTTPNDGFSIGKNSSSHGYIWNYENADISIGTNNTERIRIFISM